ncbi:MAG: AtpZ/AtpI family protein [Bacteroidales bacterium]|nr:AtpZ/AtpI family protein [Bacteroidales bacterium]
MAAPRFKKTPLHSYAYYSNMAVEMGVIIALGVFGGIKMDNWLNTSPLFTVVLSLMGVAISMYVMIKTLSPKKQPKNESKDTH